MTEREQLEETISALEARREILGDSVVNTALAPLRARLAALEAESNISSHAFMLPAPSLPDERRVVTILFCDVKGSTAMAEKFDPEAWAQIIQRALKIIIEPINRYNGTVAQVMGDGILAFFGAPLTYEDDPQRAVLAGLAILEVIQVFHEQVKHENRLDFNVRVGIHTGLVVVGRVGLGEQEEYVAIGDVVNLAARMEQTAQPGTLQISVETYKLIEQVFECEPLGEIQVKGKRNPVLTYRVIGLKGTPGTTRGLERLGLHSPLVGREAEMNTLKECINQVLGGQGGIVSILGDAGVGKSRLLWELRQWIPGDQVIWLQGNALSFGRTISYWPFQEILRSYAGITEKDSENEAWGKLESLIVALFPDDTMRAVPTVAEILPYLAILLDMHVKDEFVERVKYLDGEALGKQIFLNFRRFFERLAHTKPVVLIFDDLHWMDGSSVRLLEHIFPIVEFEPLLIVGLSRPDQQTTAARLREILSKKHNFHYTEVRLNPLSSGDSAHLVRNLLKIDDLPSRVRQIILDKAGGNPFFLEEILRALIDLGAIKRDSAGRRWVATESIEHFAIPNTVQGVILARLDRLEEDVKVVLRVAAVIGRSFLYRVLQAVVEGGDRLDEYLAKLQYIELIQEKQRIPELEYLFKHALVQEVTYESILLERRRELHRRVGQVVEILFADRLEEFYGLLAHHFAKAEAWEQAQAYLLKAADQAGRMAADTEALAQYQQAKAAYSRAFGERWDPVERSALERKIGEAFFRRGEYSEALEYFQRALAYLGHPLPTSRWAVRSALLLEITQELGRWLLRGLFHKSKSRPVAEEELAIHQTLVFAIGVSDHELFLFLAFRMLKVSEKNGLFFGMAIANAVLGSAFGYLNRLRLADYYGRRALRLARQLQRPDALGYAYIALTSLEIFRNEWDIAFEHGWQGAETFRKIGNLGAWSIPIRYIHSISMWRGDFDRALALGQEMTQVGLESADRQVWGAGLLSQGSAEQCFGRLELATSLLEKAMELTEASGNNYLHVLAANELAKCYLRQGRWQTALDILESNARFIVEHNFRRSPNPNAMLRVGLATACLVAAEQSDPRMRHAWLKKARLACQASLKWGKAFRTAKPETLRLLGRYEWLKGNAPKARWWWQKSLDEAKTLGMRYELGLTHLEIGQRLGKGEHLEIASAIFAEVGAELDLDRATKPPSDDP